MTGLFTRASGLAATGLTRRPVGPDGRRVVFTAVDLETTGLAAISTGTPTQAKARELGIPIVAPHEAHRIMDEAIRAADLAAFERRQEQAHWEAERSEADRYWRHTLDTRRRPHHSKHADALNWRFSKMTRKADIGRWHVREGRYTVVSIMSSNGAPIQDILLHGMTLPHDWRGATAMDDVFGTEDAESA